MYFRQWEQIQPFKASRMGKRKGYALENCRLGFMIPTGRYYSALADMRDQKRLKTLHRLDTLPLGVAVPIYAEPKIGMVSRYGFVFIKTASGAIYADGKRQRETYISEMREYFKLYWGELCDGVRVVKEIK